MFVHFRYTYFTMHTYKTSGSWAPGASSPSPTTSSCWPCWPPAGGSLRLPSGCLTSTGMEMWMQKSFPRWGQLWCSRHPYNVDCSGTKYYPSWHILGEGSQGPPQELLQHVGHHVLLLWREDGRKVNNPAVSWFPNRVGTRWTNCEFWPD